MDSSDNDQTSPEESMSSIMTTQWRKFSEDTKNVINYLLLHVIIDNAHAFLDLDQNDADVLIATFIQKIWIDMRWDRRGFQSKQTSGNTRKNQRSCMRVGSERLRLRSRLIKIKLVIFYVARARFSTQF